MLEDDLGAERLESLQMKVDGTGADGASSRQRNPGLAEPRQERPEYEHRSPHRFDQVIGGLMAAETRVIDAHHISVAFDAGTKAFQHLDGGIDVPQKRHILYLVGSGGEYGGDEDGKGRVLRAADRDVTGKPLPPLDD